MSESVILWIGSLTRWRHRLFWHCCWCSARGYISPISVHNLPRLRTTNVDRSNERKLLYIKKGKKQTITRTNYYGRRLSRWHSAFSKYTCSSWILTNCLEQAACGIGIHLNADKTKYTCFNQKGDIFTVNGGSLKLVDKFTYLGSSISSTENDINMRLAKVWTVISRLSIIWKSDLSNKIKCNIIQVAVVSILLYGCTTLTLTKCIEKKRDGNCPRMIWAIVNQFGKQHPTK